jgi:FAD/FMN-containing dehydrogenase/Fe-S oxidoreductase
VGRGDRAHSETAVVLTLIRSAGVPVDHSDELLSAYSYDASNYRVRPVAVAFPRSVDDVVALVDACRQTTTPLVCRGGGTSMAGNAIGPGIVVDFSRHMHAIRSVDAAAAIADVEPGVVLSMLADEAERISAGRLTFAPDPSSRNRASVAGSIGNDACGNHSVRYGRMSNHLVEVDVVTSDGARLTAFEGGVRATDPRDAFSSRRADSLSAALEELAHANLASFRTELGRIPRQVSGYHLSNLLPERGFQVARALAGSEGTCAVIVGARLRLVPKAPTALLVCLGYDDVVDAARDIPTILEFGPAAVEGIDQVIVDTMRLRRGPESVVGLPPGRAFLYVDLDGDRPEEVRSNAEALLDKLDAQGRLRGGRAVPDVHERAALWRIREDGAGLSSRPATGGESWPGWEDSAVAVDHLPEYLADFRKLLEAYSLTGLMYGHFGAGCMHIRVTYDLRTIEGRRVFGEFTKAAAALVVEHGGTLSGEHGDGRARSALLPIMYSPEVMEAFRDFRRLWDTHAILSPGSITEPDAFDANLALADVPDRRWKTSFALHPVAAQESRVEPWVHAVQSCIGVGRCRSNSGGVMCPSYRATGDERDSTRGRARALQDMVRTAPSPGAGWAAKDVKRTLDLCLSCKACSSDCPAGVDMATFKSEFLSHYYRRRLRPLSHFSLGWLPVWLKLTSRMSGLVNALLSGASGRVFARLGGITPHRTLPRFAARKELRSELAPFRHGMTDPDVILMVDSFTKGFRPEVAGAAARVAADTGRIVTCEADVCCGLPWISTGQLDRAKRVLRRAVAALDRLEPVPIVVIEPSCAASLKKDSPELLQTDAARRVSARVSSFAEAVENWVSSGWNPGPVPSSVTLQTHCHEYATFGAGVQRRALAAIGISHVEEATGCCGVAGNFGFEAEHYDLSIDVAGQALAPALQKTPSRTPVLADGFSCSMQVKHLDPERQPLHLAQLLDPRHRHPQEDGPGGAGAADC